MRIIFMRHGENPAGYRGGWSSFQLTEKGMNQVELAAIDLIKLDFNIILSSDLVRAKQTAEIVAKTCQKEIIYDPSLREINNGILAGMSNEDAKKQYPGLYFSTLRFDERYPNGESPLEFYERMKQAYMKILPLNQNVLVVTHSGVINAMYCIVLSITSNIRIKSKSFR